MSYIFVIRFNFKRICVNPANIHWAEFYKPIYLSQNNNSNITPIYSIHSHRLGIMEMSIDVFDKVRPIISHAACHHVISHSVLICLKDGPPTNWIDIFWKDLNIQGYIIHLYYGNKNETKNIRCCLRKANSCHLRIVKPHFKLFILTGDHSFMNVYTVLQPILQSSNSSFSQKR